MLVNAIHPYHDQRAEIMHLKDVFSHACKRDSIEMKHYFQRTPVTLTPHQQRYVLGGISPNRPLREKLCLWSPNERRVKGLSSVTTWASLQTFIGYVYVAGFQTRQATNP